LNSTRNVRRRIVFNVAGQNKEGNEGEEEEERLEPLLEEERERIFGGLAYFFNCQRTACESVGQQEPADSCVSNEPPPSKNCRPCFTEMHDIDVEAITMRLKFCQIDPKCYERYTNEDTKVLRKVKVCDQCRTYLMKQ
jgi:hypothetical protein